MILQPALEGMLGLKTDARSHSIEMTPYLPPQWKEMDVRNIRLAEQRVTMKVKREIGETVFSFSVASLHKAKQSRTVRLILQPIFPLGTHLQQILIDGKLKGRGGTVDRYQSNPTIRANMKSHLEVRFKHSNGVSVVPPKPQFVREGESKGLRIVEERRNFNAYVLTLEGRAGEEYLVDVFDPSGNVKHIDGAVALARDGEHLTVSVRFPGTIATGYARREVSLSM